MASTTSELLHLVFQLFFAHLNVVVFHVVVGRERGGELGSESDVENELKVVLLLNVLRLLRSRGQGLAEHIYLVVADIAHEVVANQLIYFFSFHLSAIHLLDERCGYVARTEARHLHLSLQVLERFLNVSFVVSGFQLDCDDSLYVAYLFKRNIHGF